MKIKCTFYGLFKACLYVDCFLILTCALLMYAEDDCLLEAGKSCSQISSYSHENEKMTIEVQNTKNQTYVIAKDNHAHSLITANDPRTGDKVINYLELAINAGAVWAVYFFAYDGYLYKLAIFIVLIVVLFPIRAVGALQFYWYYNIPNFVGLFLALAMMIIAYTARNRRAYINLKPVEELMDIKVNAQGQKMVRRRDADGGSDEERRRRRRKRRAERDRMQGWWGRLMGATGPRGSKSSLTSFDDEDEDDEDDGGDGRGREREEEGGTQESSTRRSYSTPTEGEEGGSSSRRKSSRGSGRSRRSRRSSGSGSSSSRRSRKEPKSFMQKLFEQEKH